MSIDVKRVVVVLSAAGCRAGFVMTGISAEQGVMEPTTQRVNVKQ